MHNHFRCGARAHGKSRKASTSMRISTFSDGIDVSIYKRLSLYTRDPSDSSRLMSSQSRKQALLGHSDLETTTNIHTHAIPESQKRAVDKVAAMLFADVRKISAATENGKVN
jgi:hypothetical protein